MKLIDITETREFQELRASDFYAMDGSCPEWAADMQPYDFVAAKVTHITVCAKFDKPPMEPTPLTVTLDDGRVLNCCGHDDDGNVVAIGYF